MLEPNPTLEAQSQSAAESNDLNRQMARIQQMLTKLDALPPTARGLARECIQTLLNFYGDGLDRILRIVQTNSGKPALDPLLDDKLVRALLLIHSLHPHSLETRVTNALAAIRPYLQRHGGSIELLGIEDGVAQLRLQGACQTCQASSETVRGILRNAIEDSCPDLAGFQIQGLENG